MDVRRKSMFVFSWLVGMICSASSQGQDTDPELRYACWGSFGPPVVSAQCPRNTVIQVRRAGLKVRSGRGHCTFSEEDCGCEFGEAGCNMPDVRKQCMGRSACRLDVTQQYIDSQTCRGFSDYMFIQFSCVNVRRGADHDICSTIATSQEQGFLHSPEYPHVYPKNRLCECSLSTSPGDVISMSLLDFHAEDDTCQHSNLVLAHDGEKEQVCSSSQNQVLVAGSNKIQLLFETDDYGGNGGFWLKYETLPTTAVKISCRSVYKPPPSTTSTTTVVQTPESTTRSSHEAETRTVMSQQQTTTSPPPPKRQPPQRRRRPQPTQESVPSSTLMTTTEANEPRPKPIFRRGDTNNNEGNKYHKLHVESRKVPPVPKPTPWWWKFTMSPTAEEPANTNLEEVYSTEREIDFQDNNVVNADVDEAIRQWSYDSPNNNNNKISVLGSGWRPDTDPLPTQPRPIPPGKLVPTPQDKLPDMKTGGVDPSTQPHANVFAPPESPADNNKGKLLSPISVKIRPGSFLSNTRTRAHPRGGSPYYLREISHVLTQRQSIDKPSNPKHTHNDQLRNHRVGKVDSGTLFSKAVGRETHGKKPHRNNERGKLTKQTGLLPNAESLEIKIKTTEQDVSKIKVSEHETGEWKKAEYGHLWKPYRNNWRWSSSDGTLSNVPALLGHIKDTIDRKHSNTAETIGSRKASIRDADTEHKENGVSGKDVLSVFRIDTYSKPAPTQNTVKNREEDETDINGPLILIESGPDTNKTFLPRTKSAADDTGDQTHGTDGTFITDSFKERHGHETVAVNVSRVADRKAEKIRDTEIRSESFYGEASNLTVTIIAACVIGGILLIIVVGMLVRFMINKADPEHQMRQMHKKECVLRRNAKILNKGAKGKSFA